MSAEHVETQGEDPRLAAIPDSHGHAKGEHKPFAEERPIPYTARMLFLWFYHACRRNSPRFMMVADHMNYLTFEDPAAVNLVRRALKLAQAGDLFGAAETAGVEVGHAEVVSKGLRRGMRYSIGAEVDNDPRSRPDAQNIVDAMKPDGMVRSVHFLPITHPTLGENYMWAFDNPEFKDLYDVVGTEAVWELYMATLLDAIEKLPGNIVGHFYVPAVFGHWPDDAVLEGYEDKLVEACAEKGMAIELNSRYIYKHYLGDEAQLEKFRAVHVRLLRKAVEKGVAIAVGSDAHSPKDQGRAFEAVLALLDEVEINEIAFPIGGRLARVALRATEEFMKQFAPPEPEPAPPAPEPPPAPVAAAPPAAKPKKPRPSRAKAAAPSPEPEAETGALPEPVESLVGDLGETVATIPMVPDQPAPPTPAPGPVKKKPTRKKPPVEQPVGGETIDQPDTIPMVPDQPVTPPEGPGAVKKKPSPKKPVKPEPKPVAKKPAKPPAKAAKKPAPKPAPKKAASKKPVAKKKAAPTKKSAAKPAAKKTAKKAPVKKAAVAKKPPAKKAPVKKAAPKKSAPKSVKKSAAKKPAAKKSAAKKARRR